MADQVPSWSDNDGVTALSGVSEAVDHLATAAERRPLTTGHSTTTEAASMPLQNLPAHLVFARHWEAHRSQFLARSVERACPLCNGRDRWTWFYSQDGYRYEVCRSCNMVHIPELIPLEAWDDYFATLPRARDYLREQMARSVEEAAAGRDRERFSRYISLLRSHGAAAAGSRVLDLGSFTGAWLRVAAEQGLSAFGVEGLAEAVRFARDRYPAMQLEHGRTEELNPSIFGGQFDVVTMWETLEHTFDPVASLRRAANALRPGGIIALTVPNVSNVQFSMLGQFCFYAYGGYHGTGHINMFSRHTLERALNTAGFELIHVSTEFGTDWRQVAHYLGQRFDRIHCYQNLVRLAELGDNSGPELSLVLNWLSPALTRLENAWLAGPILVALARRAR